MNKCRSSLSVALVAVSLLSGCGSTPLTTSLPEEVRSESRSVRFTLGSRGNIFAAGKLAKGIDCKSIKGNLQLEVKRIDRPEKVPVEFSCLFIPGSAAVHSATLNKGDYEAKFSYAAARGLQPVKLSVRYRDPDFGSSADQDFGAAVELGENQTLKNTVNYTAGDETDWIKVKGKGGKVALTLRDDSDGASKVSAQIYRFGGRHSQPVAIGTLSSKKQRLFEVDPSSDLLVKITGSAYEGDSPYSLTRRDLSAAGKRVTLNVLDCYPMSEVSSVVLLRASEGLNQNDGVEVFGIDARGNSQKLGRCQVQSVSDGQASCLLNRLVPRNVVEYRAEAFLGGKS